MERRLAAILVADVVGYSRLMGKDEAGTLDALKAHRDELIDPKVAEHSGRIVKLMGDGALVEFPSVVEAVHCAVEIQRGMTERNAEVADARRIEFRIGINVGDVIVEADDIYGDGVNVAARLEALAEPGGICVSRAVRDQIRDKLDLPLDDLGEVEVKNIARPIRVFRVLTEPGAVAPARKRRRARLWPVFAATVVALGVVLVAVGWLRPWAPEAEPVSITGTALPLPNKPSIAVLPFEDLSGGPGQDYFADGMTEDLIADLSRFSEFFVIARTSSFSYKGKAVKAQEVARELGVRYVLEGSVRKTTSRLHLVAELVDAATGDRLWAERYDRRLNELFAVQDEIVARIAGTLGGGSELRSRARVVRKSAPDLTAYDYYLRGRQAARRFTEQGFAEARRLYRRAMDLDPESPLAYEGLAWVDVTEIKFGYASDRAAAVERAYNLAQKAAALGPDDHRSRWALGVVYLWKRQHAQAIAEYERALALSPNDADLLADMADALAYVGRAAESIELAKTAIRLNPRHPDRYLWSLATGYLLTERYEDALAALQKLGNQGDARRLLAVTYAQLGRIEEARAEAAELLKANPGFSISRWAALQPYANAEDIAAYLEGLRRAGLPE